MHHVEQKLARSSRSLWARAILLVVTSAIVTTTALRIEILNNAAGGVLPSRERNELGALVKWRKAPWTNEAAWRRHRGPRDGDGQPTSRALTSDEQSQMTREVHQATANNALRDVVSNWGLLHYVLVPVSLALALSLLLAARASRSARLLGGAGVCIAIATGALMLYRQYYMSQGW